MKTVRLFFIALFLVALFDGCHPAPSARIVLPSAAALRTRIVAAQASNARAVQLAAKAEKSGLAAGSADARALVLDTTTTEQQLAAAQTQIDLLTAQLLAKQDQVDALSKHDAAATVRATKAEAALTVAASAKWHARELAAGVIFFGLVLLSLIGSQLEDILRKAESFALHEAVAAGKEVAGAALKVPALLKFLPLLAIL